jgi:hypothetical protein
LRTIELENDDATAAAQASGYRLDRMLEPTITGTLVVAGELEPAPETRSPE